MDIASLYKVFLQYPSVQTDTRKLKNGDLFFALKGPNFNGNAFAKQALEAGAAYAIIDEADYAADDRYIVVADVLTTLQQLAHHHRQQFSIPFIAITGSNGKTTTKELITTVLKTQFTTYATEGNLNNHIGVPLTLLRIKNDAQMAVIEMGANHQQEIAGYCKIAAPTHGLITNAGKAHLEGFGSLEGVRKGKGELYDFLRESNGTVFRNEDLDYLKEMAKGIAQQITYGSANAQYIGKPIMDDLFLKVAILTAGNETLLSTHLVGEYNFPNVMVAVAVGLYFGISIDEIKTAIAAYNPDNSRSQWMQQGSNQIILDAYNANPTSMRAAIQNFANAKMEHKYLWLGAMKEMGAEEHKEHEDLVALIKQHEWQQVILVGKEFEPVKGDYLYFADSRLAAEYIAAHKPENASILIKGSRGSKMEVLLESLS
ncbi:UDP-N-acetylmuramoyl-tripeptide--D-alanyl-D-alanine ligase [Taibaiella soli]|uniref:UDP-N-acetylmuramoyl-tripeptide--D-alanyl-D-alanine ligase n=1 Tax=Taibaiella soli TaxID=1649169 RepID=A0A2W2B5M9_9BACT|nr:UDP-N-acetylmuramoyl-tripeptide--D-alanyl-D-alanine ligase [Taibaiella soli]PZF71509.1 UDP-N-acetylmuramoylalanyl-D-glutamate--2,6-diaminopimelate ligase [Taibaiella soli]